MLEILLLIGWIGIGVSVCTALFAIFLSIRSQTASKSKAQSDTSIQKKEISLFAENGLTTINASLFSDILAEEYIVEHESRKKINVQIVTKKNTAQPSISEIDSPSTISVS